MTAASDIRDNLKMVIRDKGYIQASVARRANMSPAKLSQILNKERRLEANEMFDICGVIEMTPMDLKNYSSASKSENTKAERSVMPR